MPEIAIRTEKLTRRFGALTAVDAMDLAGGGRAILRLSGTEWRR